MLSNPKYKPGFLLSVFLDYLTLTLAKCGKMLINVIKAAFTVLVSLPEF